MDKYAIVPIRAPLIKVYAYIHSRSFKTYLLMLQYTRYQQDQRQLIAVPIALVYGRTLQHT